MNRAIEQVFFAAEIVGIATRPVVTFDHQNVLAGFGQQRGRGQASDAASNYDGIVFFLARLGADTHLPSGRYSGCWPSRSAQTSVSTRLLRSRSEERRVGKECRARGWRGK